MPFPTTEEQRIRRQAIEDALATRVLALDGAMGTMLQDRQLTAAVFGGPALEGCNENLIWTRPDVILDIHRAYYEAGSDIVETNSFGSTQIVLAEYDLQTKAYELNVGAARLARRAAEEFSTPGRGCGS
jgi:5-methyltetrahydrofolate--homocysteine methyltransferase